MELPFGLPSKYALVLMPLIGLALLLFLSETALAHRPLFAEKSAADPDSALRVSDPAVSHVIYAELTGEHPHRWFRFESEKPQAITIQIGVPRGSVPVPAEPIVALFGPGLADRPPSLPVSPPQGRDVDVGATLVARAGQPEPFDEPITGTRSFILVNTTLRLPKAGTFYGAIYDALGGTGKMWVGLGQREGFRWSDVLKLPGWIRDVRRFHQTPGWPRWVWVSAVGLSTVVAVVAARVIQGVRRI